MTTGIATKTVVPMTMAGGQNATPAACEIHWPKNTPLQTVMKSWYGSCINSVSQPTKTGLTDNVVLAVSMTSSGLVQEAAFDQAARTRSLRAESISFWTAANASSGRGI